jgi:non-specific serine/threonine protein kinase
MGSLFWDEVEEAQVSLSLGKRLKDHAPVQGIVLLAKEELGLELPPALGYWRDFGKLYLTRLCQTASDAAEVPPSSAGELATLTLEVPPMKGSEFLSPEILSQIWRELDAHTQAEIKRHAGGLEAFFRGTTWHQVGRVTFHLAENKRDEERPFAFLATYTNGVAASSQLQHLPLGRAVQEYAGAKNKGALLKLFQPVQAASAQSGLIKELVDSGHIYHPQAWTISQAYRFLKEIPVLEQSGVLVRVPNWWKASSPSRPTVSITMGSKKSSQVGAEALLDFQASLTLDGETITEEEWKQIASSTQGLAFLKGRWVEIDKTRLEEVLRHWKQIESNSEGIGFLQGMRLLSGAAIDKGDAEYADESTREWTRIEAGPWLNEILAEMRSPETSAVFDLLPGLHAELRPYQKKGLSWLWLMHRLGLGACLADDMGLGKTIQILAFLLQLKNSGLSKTPSLLIVPASLLANWQAEAARFTPSLKLWMAHPSNPEFAAAEKIPPDVDLALTTYGMLSRSTWLLEADWHLVILDEAQAIKNPSSNQTRSVKKLKSAGRFALTGTPVENSLGDLWSLFDFICPGLLGTAQSFNDFIKRLADDPRHFAPLRNLTHPYILRRLKTDKSIIADLPDKTEVKTYCSLSKKQTVLYQQAVIELADILKTADKIRRRGIILAFLIRFKQICNHPDHWTSTGPFAANESGKFERLEDLTSQIAERQEKALIFTQFKEMTGPLSRFLESIFKRPGLTLHGQTNLKTRREMVESFQKEEGPPFFVLSLKAGGVGLNLTQACHVIHFDRWWNPAVENQATDRAFRLGQKKNVLVHKFICRGTVEDKIDALIDSKKSLAEDVLGAGGETALTEMSNDELLRFVSLDLNTALTE